MHIRIARPDDATQIARVHIDTWRTAYRAILPASFLDALSYEVRAELWREWWLRADPQQWLLVAEDEAGCVIGFARGGLERDETPGFDGEVYALYLLAEHHRRGIGRQLMAACARLLEGQGFGAALVWVLEENRPARAFYEALDGRLIGSKPIVIGGTTLTEVSYGWQRLRDLLDATLVPANRAKG